MRKGISEEVLERPRVLARVLADELRNVRGSVFNQCDCGDGGGGGATVTETGTKGEPDWDITNVGGDGD